METGKKIVINKTELQVTECYPYRYDYGKGKEVLRIKVSEQDHEFSDVKALKDCKETIQYLEKEISRDGAENMEWVIKGEYEGYSLDFSSQYASGEFSVEITRENAEFRMLKQLTADMAATQNLLDILTLEG